MSFSSVQSIGVQKRIIISEVWLHLAISCGHTVYDTLQSTDKCLKYLDYNRRVWNVALFYAFLGLFLDFTAASNSSTSLKLCKATIKDYRDKSLLIFLEHLLEHFYRDETTSAWENAFADVLEFYLAAFFSTNIEKRHTLRQVSIDLSQL